MGTAAGRPDPRFCPWCGAAVGEEGPGGHRLCAGCGRRFFLDPKVAACVLIPEDRGVWLIRRALPGEAVGLWDVPGGFVDRGERVEDAAQREAAEETGMIVDVTDLLGVYSYPGQPVVVIFYLGRRRSGRARAGDGVDEVRLFDHDRVPWGRLAFPSTDAALKKFLAKPPG